MREVKSSVNDATVADTYTASVCHYRGFARWDIRTPH